VRDAYYINLELNEVEMAENQSEKQPEKKRNPADHLKDKRFKPGQSGNPAGRPKKGSAIADILNKIGDELISVGGEDITKREAILRKVYVMAGKGNMSAINYISDRTEGKAVETVQPQQGFDHVEYLE